MTQENESQRIESAASDTYPVMLTPDQESEERQQESAGRDAEMAEMLRRLAQLVSENGLSELTVMGEGVTLTVKAAFEAAPVPAPGAAAVFAHPHVLPPDQSPAYSETAVTTPPLSATPARVMTAVALESPMVGVFYRSPSPEDPPFVSVGDLVRVGQTIGLIEAMKVYSEVPSETAGRVTETPVESGKLVQQGQPLIFVEPQ